MRNPHCTYERPPSDATPETMSAVRLFVLAVYAVLIGLAFIALVKPHEGWFRVPKVTVPSQAEIERKVADKVTSAIVSEAKP